MGDQKSMAATGLSALVIRFSKVLLGLEVSDGEGGEGMGTDGKGGGVRGAVSFLLFGFPKRQRGREMD
ncbi:hypothetical protein SLEP1_g39395 [Rubroshorea leprosula]|uniref:Uncharacterized protein n=1 Tax=Rubroshorea leprosula TaxID=152421 RepID=A0AAV5L024_9ROSI|nr:hypothetical protein SLEP1_g39395 [Rubroshorea leprosula]